MGFSRVWDDHHIVVAALQLTPFLVLKALMSAWRFWPISG
jgi:hypothetical protein